MGPKDKLLDGVVAAELDYDELDDDLVIAEADACPPQAAPEGVLAMAAGPLGAAAGGFVRTDELGGVPLFSIEPEFHQVLLRTLKTVRARAPRSFGNVTRITCAGTLVAKPGFHGLGRAFDHDAWTFEHVDIRPIAGEHASASRAKRQRYWALAALMRSRSAYVLHGHYDAAHGDHLHQDDGGPRPFTTGSQATVKLVQAVCKHIYDRSVAIDGAFGPKSQAAVTAAMQRVNLAGDVFDPVQFNRFLLRSGRLGFELSTT
jgi:hypothetical protein